MQRSEAAPIASIPSTNDALAYFALSFMSVGWASAFIAGKIVLLEISPLSAAAVRYAVAALVLLPVAARQPPSVAQLRSVLGPLSVMIVCGGLLYQWLVMVGLQYTTATNSSLLIALNPVLTLLLSALFGERLDRNRIAGVLLALTGAAIVISRGDATALMGLATGSLHFGDALTIVAAFCWACLNVASRRVVSVLSAGATNCIVYGLGAIALITINGPRDLVHQLGSATAPTWTGLFVMAVFSSVIGGQLFLYGVRTVGVSRTVVFVYVTPVLTALASVVWLGETLGPAHIVGGAAVLAGVYWSTQRR